MYAWQKEYIKESIASFFGVPILFALVCLSSHPQFQRIINYGFFSLHFLTCYTTVKRPIFVSLSLENEDLGKKKINKKIGQRVAPLQIA
jgi:hypothetical protein